LGISRPKIYENDYRAVQNQDGRTNSDDDRDECRRFLDEAGYNPYLLKAENVLINWLILVCSIPQK